MRQLKDLELTGKRVLVRADLNVPLDDSGMVKIRTAYIEAAGPVGSVPPPGTAKGAVKAGMQALTGRKAHVFIDRIGERLAFERTGTRLYEALITKCCAQADGDVLLPGGVSEPPHGVRIPERSQADGLRPRREKTGGK